ncbi:hypothetical protein GH721_09140 [Kriegella sp. EG-1]|nr:hypothetical protein [Flavobacteriaceae bacterium EG-1]
MRVIKLIMTLLLLVVLTACPGSKNDNPDVDPIGDPGSVALVFPENNSECTEGEAVNNLQSAITFIWEASQNADSYEVNLKNLENGDTQKTEVTTNESTITLKSNTPYEWFVVTRANNSDVAPVSAIWKFYNAGEGVTNYAPFPASVVSPRRGESIAASTAVSLEWQGSDVDNDIVEFEVLFGTVATPSTNIGVASQSSMSVNVVSGQTYFWQVITKDNVGNTSQSEVFDFKVQ